MTTPAVSVVVLAFGDEPLLQLCITSVLASTRPDGEPLDLEVILVDNGAEDAVQALTPDPRLRVTRMATNTGFAGGCNAGALDSSGRTLVFLNSDATTEPLAVWALTQELEDPRVGLVCGSVRLMRSPDVINSVGNPVHFLGLVWSGGYGDPAAVHLAGRDVTAASGAFFATRRSTWEALGGFDPLYFAYHEDVELSLRCWQRGLSVRYRPDAVVLHDYEFSRNRDKHFLLERNRLLAVATVYPTPVLLAVLPALLGFEVAVLALATVQGWLPAKMKGYLSLLRHSKAIRSRRGQLQRENTLAPAEFATLLTARIEPAVLGRQPGLGAINWALSVYWRFAQVLLRRSRLAVQQPR